MRKLQINGETIYFEKSNKYKVIIFRVAFIQPLQSNNLAENTFLSTLPTYCNLDYPDELLFSTHLQDLYDMRVRGNIERKGLTNIINYYVSCINPKYIDNPNLLKEVFDVFTATIFKPYFNDDLIAREKQFAIDNYKSLYSNKVKYATNQFIKTMFNQEKYSLLSCGTIEDIEKVNRIALEKAHQVMLESKRVLYVEGDLEEAEIIKLFSSISFPKVKQIDLSFIDNETKEISEVTKKEEPQDISQSVLCLGFRTKININDNQHTAMFFFNAMLGGFFHSTLTKVIREEHSLAYYVASRYDSRKGFLGITVLIDSSQADFVIKLINEIINDYQQGNIDEETYELSKKAIISGFKQNRDNLMVDFYQIYNEIGNIKNYTPAEEIQMIEQVTIEDIKQASKTIKLDTIYFLKGEHHEESHE